MTAFHDIFSTSQCLQLSLVLLLLSDGTSSGLRRRYPESNSLRLFGPRHCCNPNGGGWGEPSECRSRMQVLEYSCTQHFANGKADVDCGGTHACPEASDPAGHQMPVMASAAHRLEGFLGEVILWDVSNRWQSAVGIQGSFPCKEQQQRGRLSARQGGTQDIKRRA